MNKIKIQHAAKNLLEEYSDKITKIKIRFCLLLNYDTRRMNEYERERIVNRIWRAIQKIAKN